VSEYVPEIVAFTQQIIDNGFAYEGGGSVWFDVAKFEGAPQQDESGGWRHEYAKLQPGSKGNRKLLDEGEGGYYYYLSLNPEATPYDRLQAAEDERRDTGYGKLMYRRPHWQSRQTSSVRLCTVESQVQAGRAVLAFAVGRGTPRLAYRVLGYGFGYTGQGHGYTFGRGGLDVSSS
jgi:hypothetical protein